MSEWDWGELDSHLRSQRGLRDTEIQNSRITVRAHHDVLRGDVAVNDVQAAPGQARDVCGVQPFEGVAEHAHHHGHGRQVRLLS